MSLLQAAVIDGTPNVMHWPIVTAVPALDTGEVHVWSAQVPVEEGSTCAKRFERLQSLLDADERIRAARYVPEFPAREFAVTRGILRWLLGAYAGLAPEELRFECARDGKPFLGGCPIRFNVSHSHGLSLFAFTRERDVGVDVEKVRHDFQYSEIAERYFSERERAVLRGLPAVERPAAFFRCWTRKEAWLKAKGTGLRLPLAGFDVTLAPGAPPRLLATHFDVQEAQRWSLLHLEPPAGFAAAVAVESPPPRLRCYRLDHDSACLEAIPKRLLPGG